MRRTQDEPREFHDAARAERALHIFDRLHAHSRPLFPKLALGKPHSLCEAPEPYFSMYE